MKTNGGPAFPVEAQMIPWPDEDYPPGHPERIIGNLSIDAAYGMSLRDYFAAAALSVLRLDREITLNCLDQSDIELQYMNIASQAYCIADMMLIRRDPVATAEWTIPKEKK